MRDRIVAGNWKMNMNAKEAKDLFASLVKNVNSIQSDKKVIIAPPSVYLSEFCKEDKGAVYIAAQNCSEKENGAFTGEISAEMLSSIGVTHCLVGHSERRLYQQENNELLKEKVDALLQYKLTPIYCCGESLHERENGDAFTIVGNQIKEALFHLTAAQIEKTILAYEPVWAIGTGKTASASQAQEMHAYIRNILTEKYGEETASNITILYGGSCNQNNAKELFSEKDIDGGLIGGASLKTESFIGIIQS